jgi:hypothetical protein
MMAEAAPGAPPTALSAEQHGATERTDRAAPPPDGAALPSRGAVAEPNVDKTPSATMANAAPSPPLIALSAEPAEQRSAADWTDRAAPSPGPGAVTDPNADATRPPLVANVAPTAPDDHAVAAEPPELAQPLVPPTNQMLRQKPNAKSTRLASYEGAGESQANPDWTRSGNGVRHHRHRIWSARPMFWSPLAFMFEGRSWAASRWRPRYTTTHRGRQ